MHAAKKEECTKMLKLVNVQLVSTLKEMQSIADGSVQDQITETTIHVSSVSSLNKK